jgi:hypothetical protein
VTAVYTPARSFLCESKFWHPSEHNNIQHLLPKAINSLQDLEILNPNSLLYYPTVLMSAGHSDLEFKKPYNEYGVRVRDRTKTTLISDSGGFQIAKGTWNVSLNPPDQAFRQLRQNILNWQQKTSDWAVTLDVPYLIFSIDKSQRQTGITTTQQALKVIVDNMDYYMANSTGACGWLNALQGRTFQETDEYFDCVKDYNVPGYRNDYCRGWAFGNLQSSSAEALLRRMVILKHRGHLQHTERIHILGKSKIYQTVFFNAVARHFPDIKFTYDSSSPYLQAAKGQIVTGWNFQDRWRLSICDIPWGPLDSGCGDSPYLKTGSVSSQIFDRIIVSEIINSASRSGMGGIGYILLQHHNLDVMFQSQLAAEQAFQQGGRPSEMDWDCDVEEVLADILTADTEQQAMTQLKYHSRRLSQLSNHRESVIDSYNNLFLEV